ncbi:hypothetical protein J7I93_15940 [Bacillus sp. ISL-47]|uniref:hypothetical protein n=1 Tax=Bacillus sp. ISL-47 TaxID=2819130 RepID=UPI001BE98866|nr:hypothetical protein [Bacillus sp. ISL-47]MBT2689679.1 hypothetical protein [Bacillus sp. ISL-47]MBT2709325.1 hypothetical protein [Pseudomonas sp. ISL-84]
MNITSIKFTDPPVYHQFPPIYENLGLPEVSSFIEQRFEFAYTSGKTDRTGHGSIRLYKQQGDLQVIIPEKLSGIGPVRLEKLKRLLLEKVNADFIQNLESEPPERKVYYTDFRRKGKGLD